MTNTTTTTATTFRVQDANGIYQIGTDVQTGIEFLAADLDTDASLIDNRTGKTIAILRNRRINIIGY